MLCAGEKPAFYIAPRHNFDNIRILCSIDRVQNVVGKSHTRFSRKLILADARAVSDESKQIGHFSLHNITFSIVTNYTKCYK